MAKILEQVASAEICSLYRNWLDYLVAERRFSDHTASNYGRDVLGFLAFAMDHGGEMVAKNTLIDFSLNDFRSFLAARKMAGLSARSMARSLSSIRNFYKYLDRRENIRNSAIAEVKTPKVPKTVPRPLSIGGTEQVLDNISVGAKDDWVKARDIAVVTLLYGCGLRISEALSLNLNDRPADDSIIIKGKGEKERVVPVLPIVIEAVKEAALAVDKRAIHM